MRTFALALSAAAVQAVPTAIFHGLGDACIYGGMRRFTKQIASGTGDYADCIEVGNGTLTSILTNFETQAEMACQNIQADSNFTGVPEINVMGLSQGALIARYIATTCDLGDTKVRNLASLGGPNMGVDAIPGCFDGFICNIVNEVARSLVYLPIVQNHLGPAGYFRNPQALSTYLKDNVFLPMANNEEGSAGDTTVEASQKARFEALNGLLLMMFNQDTVVYPKESEWFQTYDDNMNLLPLEDSDFYKNDYLGLKALNEGSKITFSKVEGDHLQFSTSDINDTIVPFLLS